MNIKKANLGSLFLWLDAYVVGAISLA